MSLKSSNSLWWLCFTLNFLRGYVTCLIINMFIVIKFCSYIMTREHSMQYLWILHAQLLLFLLLHCWFLSEYISAPHYKISEPLVDRKRLTKTLTFAKINLILIKNIELLTAVKFGNSKLKSVIDTFTCLKGWRLEMASSNFQHRNWFQCCILESLA